MVDTVAVRVDPVEEEGSKTRGGGGRVVTRPPWHPGWEGHGGRERGGGAKGRWMARRMPQ